MATQQFQQFKMGAELFEHVGDQTTSPPSQACRFRFPLKDYAAKTGKTWLPRGRPLAELSIGVTPLHFLNWPLIRGPFPYAGVPFKRFAPFPPP